MTNGRGAAAQRAEDDMNVSESFDPMTTDIDEMSANDLRFAIRAVRGLVRIAERKADMAMAAAEDAGRLTTRYYNLLSTIYRQTDPASTRAQLEPLFAWRDYTAGLTARNVWTDHTPGGPEVVVLWDVEDSVK